MKKNIHPKWFKKAKITCACGNTFEAGSVSPSIEVEICSACHPFFTGKMKFIDTKGTIERFKAKQEAARSWVKKDKKKKTTQAQPQSLKEILQSAS